MPGQPLDLPLITEATHDFYRNVYADPDLGPVMKGINMIVLRTHVSYFINQLTMFDAPMTPRQLEYLRKTHLPIIAKHGLTQHHYDIMMQYLTDAMRSNDAEEDHLEMVQAKLSPLRDLFPLAQQSEDGHVEVRDSSGGMPTSDACDDCSKLQGKAGSMDHQATKAGSSSTQQSWFQRMLSCFCSTPATAGPMQSA